MLKISAPVNGEYPFEAVLLTGQPLYTKSLGNFVIDLQSLQNHKERITVDWNHEEDEVLGNAGEFAIAESGYVVKGILVEGMPRVQNIVELTKHGTEFEMSPTICEQDGDAEVLAEGETAEVNGITVAGPLTIYRNVPLRGMAVCPHGTDRFTKFTLLKQETNKMAEETKDTAAAGSETKVKDEALQEFADVFGPEKGMELWQSGADIGDIRKLKELLEKYGVPGKPEPAPTTELSDGNAAPEVKKEPETTDLKAVITALKSEMTALKADITKVRAAVPRGEGTPVHHGYNSGESAKEKAGSPESRYAQKLKK